MIKLVTRSLLVVAAAIAAIAAPAGAAPSTDALAWGACPPMRGLDPRQQCATLAVPLDYTDPTGETIEIAVSRIEAAPSPAHRGVLLYNPGGPGASGLSGPTRLTRLLPASVRERYDLVGFDPRGIGWSAPVSCSLAPADQDLLRFVPYPEPDGDISENVAYSQRAAAGCAATSGHLLPHITTANTARDMDALRAALGEQKINYLGYSYGTYLGSVYATLFPQRTDRFLLDSVVHPDRIWRETFSAWGPAAEIAFPGFAEYAAANDAAFGLGDTPAEVRQKFFELLAEVETEPYPLPGLTIDHKWYRELTRTALRDEVAFAELAFILQLIDEREAAGARLRARGAEAAAALRERAQLPAPAVVQGASADAFPEVPVDNAFAAPWAVVCGDADWPESPADYQRDVLLADELFPIVGASAANIWPCAFWPFDPPAPVAVEHLDGGSALLFQSTKDPATPLDGAVALRHKLGERSRIVSFGNGGHALSFTGRNDCADALATQFLASGELPPRDVSCPAEPLQQ